ncbi:hypothetical protein PSEUDO9AG_50887 [Pseudomonas sp. 9Ag]|nr:hypothetical protein PSEUDO9AG_50887 [Pseudomonas sp. 9Ag]
MNTRNELTWLSWLRNGVPSKITRPLSGWRPSREILSGLLSRAGNAPASHIYSPSSRFNPNPILFRDPVHPHRQAGELQYSA